MLRRQLCEALGKSTGSRSQSKDTEVGEGWCVCTHGGGGWAGESRVVVVVGCVREGERRA